MQGETDETVGEGFEERLLTRARDLTLEVVTQAAAQVKPGMTEADARAILLEIQTRLGAPKAWHPPQIRFGENTLLPFGKPGRNDIRLQKDDLFFFDIGPLFAGYEGDVGRPFTVGDDPEMHQCCTEIAQIWREVRDHWSTSGVTGSELYAFAAGRAEARGWQLTLEKADGHRVSDFPHIARRRGSIKGLTHVPAPRRWILEIQIRHPARPFGAFYEDLLV